MSAGSSTAREAAPPASCFWCERLHPGEHSLSVCPACVFGYMMLRSLAMSAPDSLTNEAINEALGWISPGNYALGHGSN